MHLPTEAPGFCLVSNRRAGRSVLSAFDQAANGLNYNLSNGLSRAETAAGAGNAGRDLCASKGPRVATSPPALRFRPGKPAAQIRPRAVAQAERLVLG